MIVIFLCPCDRLVEIHICSGVSNMSAQAHLLDKYLGVVILCYNPNLIKDEIHRYAEG